MIDGIQLFFGRSVQIALQTPLPLHVRVYAFDYIDLGTNRFANFCRDALIIPK